MATIVKPAVRATVSATVPRKFSSWPSLALRESSSGASSRETRSPNPASAPGRDPGGRC